MTAARTGELGAGEGAALRAARASMPRTARGQTALMWAAAEGHAAVVATLLAAGADLQSALPSGFTPLLFAVREGRLDVVRVLLEAGADVNEAIPMEGPRRRYGGPLPRAGASALLLAVANAHFEVAAALLDAGANPNADVTGYTPLHVITVVRRARRSATTIRPPTAPATMTSLELVRKLVAKGAERQRDDDQAGEPEQHAHERDRRDAVPARRGDRGRRAADGARRRSAPIRRSRTWTAARR